MAETIIFAGTDKSGHAWTVKRNDTGVLSVWYDGHMAPAESEASHLTGLEEALLADHVERARRQDH